ncbi:hypothetical protein [Nitrosococcus oceani]|nr:hypothetical protein [Nitrosococcus oceani]KFI19954.1 hypothetical protein IB75_06045 [Nitrosococcus oceani C-27]GEM19308.1 hypothetical protein NONS58_06920 [Nitrosococcus oceani]
MALPWLVHYVTESEYRDHYKRIYSRGTIHAFDGIRIYFQSRRFEHAFYEGQGKNRFSPIRAQRIDWIKATLEHPAADLYQGWDKKNKVYVSHRRVSVVYEDFVVVVELGLKSGSNLKGNFITCYQAENSINKIRTSPIWNRNICTAMLKGRNGR